MPRQRGPVYQLERVPPDLWRRAKARAALDGHSLRAVVLALLDEYAAGTLTPKHELVARLSAGAPKESHAEAPMTECVESLPLTHFSSNHSQGCLKSFGRQLSAVSDQRSACEHSRGLLQARPSILEIWRLSCWIG